MSVRQLHFNAFMRPASIHTGAWRYPGAWPDMNFNFAHIKRCIQTLEAAKIDGASHWQTFRYIIFAYIRPALIVSGLFRLIDSFKAFPLIYVLTDGGPGSATEVTNYYAFVQAFNFSYWGYASAIATMMVVGIFLLSWLISILGADTVTND